MYKRVITPDLCQKYAEMVGTKSYSQIGHELGVSKAVVFKMSEITGIKPTERQKISLKHKAHKALINRDLESRIKEMWETTSTRDMAVALRVTRSAVVYHANRMGLKRTKEEQSKLLSKAVRTQNAKIRRHLQFGMEISNKHLCLNQKLAVQKHKMRTYLRQNGYKIEEGSNLVTVLPTTERKRYAEQNAKKLGLRFSYDIRAGLDARGGSLYDALQRFVNNRVCDFKLDDALFVMSATHDISHSQVTIKEYLACMALNGYLSRNNGVFRKLKPVPFEVSASDLRRALQRKT